MASSFVNGDAGTGVLKSPLFRIERRYVNFLIGGGVDYQREYVALWIDGKEVKRSTGYNRRVMEYESWDVAEYMGKCPDCFSGPIKRGLGIYQCRLFLPV